MNGPPKKLERVPPEIMQDIAKRVEDALEEKGVGRRGFVLVVPSTDHSQWAGNMNQEISLTCLAEIIEATGVNLLSEKTRHELAKMQQGCSVVLEQAEVEVRTAFLTVEKLVDCLTDTHRLLTTLSKQGQTKNTEKAIQAQLSELEEALILAKNMRSTELSSLGRIH